MATAVLHCPIRGPNQNFPHTQVPYLGGSILREFPSEEQYPPKTEGTAVSVYCKNEGIPASATSSFTDFFSQLCTEDTMVPTRSRMRFSRSVCHAMEGGDISTGGPYLTVPCAVTGQYPQIGRRCAEIDVSKRPRATGTSTHVSIYPRGVCDVTMDPKSPALVYTDAYGPMCGPLRQEHGIQYTGAPSSAGALGGPVSGTLPLSQAAGRRPYGSPMQGPPTYRPVMVRPGRRKRGGGPAAQFSSCAPRGFGYGNFQRSAPQAGWRKLLCVEEMDALARHAKYQWITNGRMRQRSASVDPCCESTCCEERVGSTTSALGCCLGDSAPVCGESSGDETECVKVLHHGPRRPRSRSGLGRGVTLLRSSIVDDLDLNLRDWFPWLSNLIDACSCSEKVTTTRAMLRPRVENGDPYGPVVETVCLECQSVLKQRPIPARLLSQHGGGPPGHLLPHVASVEDNGERLMERGVLTESSLPVYEGYQHWSIHPKEPPIPTYRRDDRIPLPLFTPGPHRCFRNMPGPVPKVGTDYFDTDSTGRVILPDFPIESPSP